MNGGGGVNRALIAQSTKHILTIILWQTLAFALSMMGQQMWMWQDIDIYFFREWQTKLEPYCLHDNKYLRLNGNH